MFCNLKFLFGLFIFKCNSSFGGHPRNLAWTGGPLHMECEHRSHILTLRGDHIRENVIAVKAVTFSDDIYILTPRLKRGVLSTVWIVVRGRHNVELQAFPDERSHALGDCNSIQNAVDFYLDYMGNLWVLDSGVVETLEHARCTCRPKVVVINIILKKVTKVIDVSSLANPSTILQNIVVEYALGGPFIYISDSSRGAILIHDTTSGDQWSVLACAPATGLQMALVKRSLTQPVLILNRLHHKGMLELDTAALRKKKSITSPKTFGNDSQSLVLLGSDSHHVYLRHFSCADVLVWNAREPFNASNLANLHSAGPLLIPTSVAADPLKPIILILDTNYAHTVFSKTGTYHRITFVEQP